MKKIINILAFIMIGVGLFILIQPYISLIQRKSNASAAVSEFRAQAERCRKETESVPDNTTSAQKSEGSGESSAQKDSSNSTEKNSYLALYREMQQYNKKISEEKQTGLRDVFSYSTSSFDLSSFGVRDDMVGYLTIDRMGVQLPVYIGSSSANMNRGATIMNQTSMPIGGNNTNCVIAAHRMAGYFGDIELLSRGDIITLDNLWGTLYYRVAKIIVIDPYDTDKVKIIPDKDMITLLTCHPYWDNSSRYVVYCERITSSESRSSTQQPDTETSDTADEGKLSRDAAANTDADSLPSGKQFQNSQSTISAERLVRNIGAAVAAVLMIFCLVNIIRSFLPDLKRKRHN